MGELILIQMTLAQIRVRQFTRFRGKLPGTAFLYIPSRNRLTASLYWPQSSPTAAFKLVYSGSRSMRCAALTLFEAFCDAGKEDPLTLRVSGTGAGPEIESERLRAAGSMSGMVDWLVFQRDAPECFTAAGPPSGGQSYFALYRCLRAIRVQVTN